MPSPSTFAAAASALGYAYQFRIALQQAIQKLQTLGDSWEIRIEAADDIEISGVADVELLQLKHRADGALTDASADLWKTVRVWCAAVSSGSVDAVTTSFLLLTTARVAAGSIGSLLTRGPERDEAAALERMLEVARTSESETNRTAYEAFLALEDNQRSALIRAVEVVGSATDAIALEDELRRIARVAVKPELVAAFVERLEGWWFSRCLRQLAQPGGGGILGHEFDATWSDLRESFGPQALPIDEDIAELAPESDGYRDRLFIKQLDLIDLGVSRIDRAVRNYVRAFAQRSRWTREGLLQVGELRRFERRLVEEWEIYFDRMQEALGEEATESVKIERAKELYAWAEEMDIAIRPLCTEPFVARGSLQILSDAGSVGWHPDFVARLIDLLEPTPEH